MIINRCRNREQHAILLKMIVTAHEYNLRGEPMHPITSKNVCDKMQDIVSNSV
jgi:hypothetical protein